MRHGKGATAEVAAQDKEIRHSSMPLPARTVRRAPSGRVQVARGGEEKSRERRESGVENAPLVGQEEEKRGRRV